MVSTWRAATALLLSTFGAISQAELADPTQPDTPGELATIYARYLASGRSDVEIHLSSAGRVASARLRARGDGSHSCHVSGLQRAGLPPSGDDGQLSLTGLLVHEATHCLVGPHIGGLRSHSDDPASAAADSLILLCAESISDARAVIEVFRRDGVAAAQVLVSRLLPQRLAAQDAGHATAPALNAALAFAVQRPAALADPAHAFAAALEIGHHSALQGVRDSLATQGQSDLLSAPAFTSANAALEVALRAAQRAFESGRHANDAITVRRSNDRTSADDRHVFIGKGGSLRSVPVVSAEGAHSLTALQGQLAPGQPPEQQLAAQWLLRDGRLEPETLAHTHAVFVRFIRSVGGASEVRQATVLRLLGGMILGGRPGGQPGEPLSALLDNAAERLGELSASGR